MSFDPGTLRINLSAAVGDEPALVAELRTAFLDSVQRHLDQMRDAQGEGEWQNAALRLKGLAASFGAVPLMALAQEAAEGEIGDEAVLMRLMSLAKGYRID